MKRCAGGPGLILLSFAGGWHPLGETNRTAGFGDPDVDVVGERAAGGS